jgi:serine/threonine protein kinase
MALRIFTASALGAATDGFADSQCIGGGGCGRVFRGTLASGETVAVKRWAGGTNQQHSVMELMAELNTLGTIEHPNLLPVLGFVCQPPHDLMLVTHYLSRGSLQDALHGTAGTVARVEGLDAAWRLSFLSGLARGVQALQASNFVHRDVKSANVLIGDDWQAVLADAGVSRRMRADADATAAATGTRVIGTDGYMDPEYADTMELTYKSDVFSVGVVVLEMLTGRPAWDPSERPPLLWRRFRSIGVDDQDERVGRVVTEAAVCWGAASLGAGAVVALASLALRATAEVSARRPSIDEMIVSLEEIQVGGGGGEGGGDEAAPRECVICLSAVRSVRFDCGHMLTCDTCTGLLLAGESPRCPQCRAPASIAAQLRADPLDPTYQMVSSINVQPGGGAGDAGASSLSDEDVLRAWRGQCPALQELWPMDADASSWIGVTFGTAGENGMRRVVKIELRGKLGRTGELPAALGGLRDLTVLDLCGNQLSSIPAALGGLGSLIELGLGGNRLTIVPAALGDLSSLTHLWLSRNQLTSLPAALGRLSSLTHLFLIHNQLTRLPAALEILRERGVDMLLDRGVTIDIM